MVMYPYRNALKVNASKEAWCHLVTLLNKHLRCAYFAHPLQTPPENHVGNPPPGSLDAEGGGSDRQADSGPRRSGTDAPAAGGQGGFNAAPGRPGPHTASGSRPQHPTPCSQPLSGSKRALPERSTAAPGARAVAGEAGLQSGTQHQPITCSGSTSGVQEAGPGGRSLRDGSGKQHRSSSVPNGGAQEAAERGAPAGGGSQHRQLPPTGSGQHLQARADKGQGSAQQGKSSREPEGEGGDARRRRTGSGALERAAPALPPAPPSSASRLDAAGGLPMPGMQVR